jgi:hypothetical protein
MKKGVEKGVDRLSYLVMHSTPAKGKWRDYSSGPDRHDPRKSHIGQSNDRDSRAWQGIKVCKVFGCRLTIPLSSIQRPDADVTVANQGLADTGSRDDLPTRSTRLVSESPMYTEWYRLCGYMHKSHVYHALASSFLAVVIRPSISLVYLSVNC